MAAMRAFISPRLPFLGGLLSLLVAFPALAAERQVPFVMEAIPGEAIVDMTNSKGAVQLMSDGSRISLNETRNGLVIRKNGQTRAIPLYTSISAFESVKSETATLRGSEYSKVILVHIPTGSRSELTLSNEYRGGSYNDIGYYVQGGQISVVDYKNAKFVSVQFKGKETPSIKYVKDGAGNQILQFAETGGYFIVGQDLSARFVTYPDKSMAFEMCNSTQSTVSDCQYAGEHWAVDYSRGIFKKLATGDRIENVHPTQAKILARFSKKDEDGEESDAYAIVDLATGARTELKSVTEGLGNLLSVKGYTIWFTNSSPLVICFTTGPMGKFAKYDLRTMSLQDFWAALEAAKPIEAMHAAGVSLGTDSDLQKLLLGQRVDGSYQMAGPYKIISQDRFLTIKDSRRSDDSVVVGPLPSGVQIDKIYAEAGLAMIRFYSNNISTNMLVDLQSGRIFELGVSWSEAPEYSKENRMLVVRSGTIQTLYSLPMFRAYLNSSTRFGVGDRPNWTPLDEKVVSDCSLDAGPAADAVINRLLELRKPGVNIDTQELMQLMTYRLGKNERAIAAQIFQRYFLENPDHAALMFRKFKMYDRLEGDSETLQVNPCLDQYANKAILDLLDDAVKMKDDQDKVRAITFTEIAHLLVFAPYFKKFNYDSGSRRENLAERLATGAQNHPMASGIFYSKLYYFANGVIGAIMGHKREFKTDITVLIDGGNVVSQLLSTHPTTGSRAVRSSYGFYMTTVDSFAVPKDARRGQTFTHQVKWQSNKQEFHADINITAASDLREMVPVSTSMDHTSIRKDHKIVGLMVVGSNLGEQHARQTVNQYRYYYMAKGYNFLTEYKQESFVDWMKNKITSGAIDYFIKEAHSDGDEKNLFRAASRASIAVGTKPAKSPGENEEIVYLVMPDYQPNQGYGEDKLIANQEFGDWIRTREANGGGQLVYFNTSCSSFYKVIRETTAAKSKLLVAIPSVTSVLMFRNSWDNATAMLIDGVLLGQDWKTMRTNMDGIVKVKEGREDVFALPPDAKYDEYIRQALGFALEDDVRIYDSQNKQVNIDAFNTH